MAKPVVQFIRVPLASSVPFSPKQASTPKFSPHIPTERQPRNDAIQTWARLEGKSPSTRIDLYCRKTHHPTPGAYIVTALALAELALSLAEAWQYFGN